MSNIYQTGYLAAISRLPDHFYPMVHCLEGRDVLYGNPGTSLRSFIIKEFANELVVLPDEMISTVRECEQFTSSLIVMKTIMELLINQAARLIEKSKQDVAFVTRLHTQAQVIKTQFESIALQAADDSVGDAFTHDNLVGQNFKQSLIDMKTMLEEREHEPV